MNKLRTLRIEKNYTQEQVAQSVNVTTNYISMLERGIQTPGFKLAKRIADFLSVSIDDLEFFTDSSNKLFECEGDRMTTTIIQNKIRNLRESMKLTQEELATTLGITRAYLSKLENQKLSPGSELMFKICRFFSKELGEVFYLHPKV